jgi:hypothetical protein
MIRRLCKQLAHAGAAQAACQVTHSVQLALDLVHQGQQVSLMAQPLVVITFVSSCTTIALQA